jgi:hypothetical protein
MLWDGNWKLGCAVILLLMISFGTVAEVTSRGIEISPHVEFRTEVIQPSTLAPISASGDGPATAFAIEQIAVDAHGRIRIPEE